MLFIILVTYNNTSYGQYMYTDNINKLKVEIPNGFTESSTLGRLTSHKAVDGLGAAVVVSVDNSQPYSPAVINNYNDATNLEVQEALEDQLLSTVKLIKNGLQNINGNKVIALSYQLTTPSGQTAIQLSYQLVKNDKLHILRFGYPVGQDTKYLTKFYRTAQSWTVN